MDGSTSPRTVTYTVDAINRTSMNDGGTVTSYTPNALNQYSAVTGQSPAYDNNFNLTNFDGYIYTFDADNRTLSATGGGHTVTFVYDGLGRCVQRTVDGVVTNFTYDGWKPIAEWSSSDTLNAWNLYGAGADEIAMRYQTNATPSYLHYHSDQFGNVKYLLDSANAIVESYTYDAFGAPTITKNGIDYPESTCGNRFMFTGREYISAAGIYDYRTRTYQPKLGRFLQTDPIGFAGDPANLYRYCGNSPVNAVDPDGEDAIPLDHGGFWYQARPGFERTAGGFIVNRDLSLSRQCGIAGQFFAGTLYRGLVYDVPPVRTWTRGAPVSASTPFGALVATGWQNGRYPGLSSDAYRALYGANATVNHVAIFGGADPKTGEYLFYDQWSGSRVTSKTLGYSRADSGEGWYIVNGPSDHDKNPSESAPAILVGWDGDKPIFQGIPVPNPFDSTNVNIFNFPSGAMTIAAPPGVGRPDKFIQP
jgi:RHS repeat-associated protein